MKKWLLSALLLSGVASVWADVAHKIAPGENLGKIASKYGQNWKALCAYNRLANCGQIKAGGVIQIPARNTVVKQDPPACVNLNTAPWNRYGSPKLRLEGIDANPELTAEEKIEAKALVSAGRGERGMVTGDMVFKAMPFRSKKHGKIEFLHDVRVCTPKQGGRPEAMETWKLSTGKTLADMLSCGNITFLVTPNVPEAKPDPKEDPPEEAKPDPKEDPPEEAKPDPKEVPPQEAVHRWDWELVVGKEYDRTSQSTFASGAIYGLFIEGAGAEHAFGIGGTYSTWHGKTDTGFGFNGHLGGYGPAYKYSAYEGGYDFGLKLLPWATLEENGDQGQYKSQRQFDLRGVTLAYNNYARELKGEKSFFKYQLFLSVFKPTGGGGEHSWEGKQLETADISKLDHVVNAGARVGLYDFSEEDDKIGAKLWASLGWFQEAPSLAETGNWRLQLSDKHERFFIGFGRNYDLLNGGSIKGFGWSWDIRKTVYVHREETRKAQFIAKIEQAGGRLDKDGMVILPKGTDSPFKQWKAAPSDADD